MTRFDEYWKSNPDWTETIQLPDGRSKVVMKEDAPLDAKRSYENYIKQFERVFKVSLES